MYICICMHISIYIYLFYYLLYFSALKADLEVLNINIYNTPKGLFSVIHSSLWTFLLLLTAALIYNGNFDQSQVNPMVESQSISNHRSANPHKLPFPSHSEIRWQENHPCENGFPTFCDSRERWLKEKTREKKAAQCWTAFSVLELNPGARKWAVPPGEAISVVWGWKLHSERSVFCPTDLHCVFNLIFIVRLYANWRSFALNQNDYKAGSLISAVVYKYVGSRLFQDWSLYWFSHQGLLIYGILLVLLFSPEASASNSVFTFTF